MIILLSSIASVVKAFWGYVSGQGGFIAFQGTLPLLFKSKPIVYDASLLCSCDTGKVSNLYYMVLNAGAVLLTEFKAYVTGDSGTQASEGYTATVIQNLDRNDLLGASLICTCDSGKASTLYYMIP